MKFGRCASILVAVLILSIPSFAALLEVDLDQYHTKFGNLNQHDTNCGGVACGPTAAVNSFRFLQEMYPLRYDTLLIPHIPGGDEYDDMVDVANELSTVMFMDTCVICDPTNGGTYIEMFISGKYNWIEQQAKGQTRYLAQIGIAWRDEKSDFTDPPGRDPGAKPSWVSEKTAPTIDFLYNELKHGEDVELFVTGGSDHYITLTGLKFDTDTKKGSIRFIDPADGKLGDANITGLDADGFLKLDYGGGTTIRHAVSESPIPEPASWVLFASGTALLLRVRRRAQRY